METPSGMLEKKIDKSIDLPDTETGYLEEKTAPEDDEIVAADENSPLIKSN
jgi:hypothetical protein